MKRFFIDKLALFMGAVIIILLIVIQGWNFFFSITLIVLTMTSFGYLCKELIVFPLDLICGPCECDCFFATRAGLGGFYEVFRRYHYPQWFFYQNNTRIALIAPDLVTQNAELIVDPPKNTKLHIVYYRYSGILVSWSIA